MITIYYSVIHLDIYFFDSLVKRETIVFLYIQVVQW